MKKLKILLLFFFLLIPSKALAYGINNFYINATVQKNGDLEVQEYYEMNGDFNGSNRTIKFKNNNSSNFNPDAESYGGHSLHNADNVEIEEVRAVEKNGNFDFNNVGGEIFKQKSYGNSGDYGIYTVTDEYTHDGKTLKIFLPSKKNKAFYIKYKIHNIAILHNDVGEIGWNVFSNDSTESIGDLVIYMNVPDNKNTMKVWAHGPLNGKSEIISQDKVKVSISGLDAYTAIDTRIAFDKDIISESTKKTYVDALDKIIKYETKLAEEANRLRKESDERNIAYIESKLKDFEEQPSRYNYDDIVDHIDLLNETETKHEYYKLMYSYQDKVDKYEYKEFRYYIDGELDSNNYREAKDIINNVFDTNLKNKMEKELREYHSKLKMIDYRKELALTFISLGFLGIALFVYYKPIKRKKHVNPLYFREIPSDLSPACAGILVDKQINQNEVAASILDLVRRKIISIEKKENNSYDFILNNEFEELSEFDKSLVLLIFPNKTTKRINSKKIKTITNSKFTKFKTAVIDELEDKKLMKDYVAPMTKINGILFELGLIMSFTPLFPIGLVLIIVYSLMRYHNNFYIWVLKMLNIGVIILSIVLNTTVFHLSILFAIFSMIWIGQILKKLPIKLNIKYTEQGLKEYTKWHGLRNFLLDFSSLSEKEIEEIKIWEQYLIYGTALGVGKKVLQQIRLKIQQTEVDIDYDTLNDILLMEHVSSSISRISDSVVTQSLPSVNFPIASALASGSGGSYSSGSGGGGGFSGGSSGGGSFGGGGSVGRF